VLGFGLMGQAIARAVVAMGFTVVAAIRGKPPATPSAGVCFESGPDSVRRTAAKAHMLINVLPLTPATRDVLDAKLFATMPAGAVLIQLGRGEHLVEDDLILALDNGWLSAASVDVFRTEPLPGDHPFWRDPRIVVTPHQASDCATALVAEQVAQAALDVVAGRRPQTAVDRGNGY
jgi:glyoxylate/hydroxypyruvate reductase A